MKSKMKKLLALTVALVMMLTCAAAFAGTVTVKLEVNGEAMDGLFTNLGIPEDQQGTIRAVLALINALGVQVTTVEDGGQVDLTLDGEEALSVGFATNDEGSLTLVSNLIPSYVLTAKAETIQTLMQGAMQNMMPMLGMGGVGAEGGMDFSNLISESLQTSIGSFVQTFTTALVPGEAVSGEYEFEETKFDTMLPMTVDMPKIREAFKQLSEDIVKDEQFIGMIQQYGQMMGGANLSADSIKEGLAEFESHFPDTANVEYYMNSETGYFYMIGKAFYEGKEEASYEYTMLSKGEQEMTMTVTDRETGMVIGFSKIENGFHIAYAQGELYIGADFAIIEGEPSMYICSLFFMDPEKPLLNIAVIVSADGERTISMETGEKTVMSLEELMSGESEASSGLMTDFMTNGLTKLLTTLTQKVPEAAGLFSMLLMPQMTTTTPAQ